MPPGEGGGGLSSRSFFNVRVELTEEGNRRVPEVVEVLFKYLELVRAPGGINQQVRLVLVEILGSRQKPGLC